jgi:magnesium transporter
LQEEQFQNIERKIISLLQDIGKPLKVRIMYMDNVESKNNLKIIIDDSSNLSLNQIRNLLNKMSASEIAHALESSPPKQRGLLFSLLKTEEEGDVLFELGEEIQQDLLSNISNEELTEAVKELELDEIVDILQNLPEERMKKILSNMSMVDRDRIEMGLTFPDDTAGGLLNTDVISVRPDNSINEVISYLRDQKELPENTDKIFVVNHENEYLGGDIHWKNNYLRPIHDRTRNNGNRIFSFRCCAK